MFYKEFIDTANRNIRQLIRLNDLCHENGIMELSRHIRKEGFIKRNLSDYMMFMITQGYDYVMMKENAERIIKRFEAESEPYNREDRNQVILLNLIKDGFLMISAGHSSEQIMICLMSYLKPNEIKLSLKAKLDEIFRRDFE